MGIAAAASSSTCQAYGSQTCNSVGNNNVSNGTASNGTASNGSASTTSSAGTLPFTGLDVALLVAGGFVIRRLSRRLD